MGSGAGMRHTSSCMRRVAPHLRPRRRRHTVPQSGPGEYQLTPPNFKQPVFTNWPDVRPFALETGDQFRPPPPPAVTSPRYTTDFDEIKSLGEINSTTRSAD